MTVLHFLPVAKTHEEPRAVVAVAFTNFNLFLLALSTCSSMCLQQLQLQSIPHRAAFASLHDGSTTVASTKQVCSWVKKGNENALTFSYHLYFTDSNTNIFSLSSVLDNR